MCLRHYIGLVSRSAAFPSSTLTRNAVEIILSDPLNPISAVTIIAIDYTDIVGWWVHEYHRESHGPRGTTTFIPDFTYSPESYKESIRIITLISRISEYL